MADTAEIHLVARHDLEEGAERGGDEFLDGRSLLALLAQLRTYGERRFVADGLINLFFRLEVIVERARGQRRRADDVAHGRRAIAHFREDAACRLQNDLAVLNLGLLALSLGALAGVGFMTMLSMNGV